MGDKILVGPDYKGLQTNVLPFAVDNNSFPFLLNAYQWRGRIRRKRGTSLLGRLQRFFNSASTAYSPTSTFNLVAGAGNLLTGFSLQANGNIVPGTVTITDTNTSIVYTDPLKNGVLNQTVPITGVTKANPAVLTATSPFTIADNVLIAGVQGMTQLNGNTYSILNNSGTTLTINVDSTGFSPYTMGGTATDVTVESGTINYATGAITIAGGGTDAIRAVFIYYPDLPVMGLEDFNVTASQFPGTLAFDTVYSYLIQQTAPYTINNVSFYKNPLATAPYTYPNYVPKTVATPITWNGQDYQQFWTVNYQGALWATNGINVPFASTNVGMQFKTITGVAIIATGPYPSTPGSATLTIAGHGLVIGDFVFINEVVGITGINFQTGYITAVTDVNNVVVTFPYATLGGSYTSGGIAQYLTNRSDPTKDCIRWFDGDPTTTNSSLGWVNFAPPLSQSNSSISDLSKQQYYLAGARMIVPFKDRLLFIGPVIQTSSANSQVYLQDTIIYSQNGTPYYTASYTNTPSASVDNPTSPLNVFTPILTPINQSSISDAYVATSPAWFEDSTGFGGYIDAGFAQPILTASPNEDVVILGFSSRQARLVYSGNDIVPFNFFVINSELGSGSTFSIINMDRGVMTIGDHGIINTSQISSTRIDLEIPDQVFQFSLINNGAQRITAQRDFINEWVYFTYRDTPDATKYRFPNQTLQYNYRDNTWAIFNECYTTYGQFRKATGYTWATIGQEYPTWGAWNVPWSAGASTLMQPKVIGGNQQGFVLVRDEGTGEGNSLTIQSFSVNQITSPNHELNEGDYIVISGCIGTIGALVNGNIYSVFNVTANTFMINPSIGSGTYFGGGLIQRMYVPLIQTRQFPTAWQMGRKTRIGMQQYLLSTTDAGQITLLIFLSENAIGVSAAASNNGPIVPVPGSVNNALIYSTVLPTSPEYSQTQNINFNIGPIGNGSITAILVSLNTFVVPGSLSISVGTGGSVATFQDDGEGGFTVTGTGVALGSSIEYPTGSMTLMFSVAPNNLPAVATFKYNLINLQMPTASQQQQIWHRINTSLIGDTVQLGFTMSDDQMRDPSFNNQFEEIELHSFIIDVTPSSVLA